MNEEWLVVFCLRRVGWSENDWLESRSGESASEGDSLSIEGDQAMIGNGNTMGIAAQVAQHVHGAAEGWSGVDHPVFIYRENGSGSRTVWSR